MATGGNGGGRWVSGAKDPTSLGNILLNLGLLKPTDLDRGLAFQVDNPDVMLGESLVKIGVIPREIVDEVVEIQKLIREGKNAQGEVVLRKISKAEAQTQKTMTALDELTEVQAQLIRKLKEP
jgi:hypothetical protein